MNYLELFHGNKKNYRICPDCESRTVDYHKHYCSECAEISDNIVKYISKAEWLAKNPNYERDRWQSIVNDPIKHKKHKERCRENYIKNRESILKKRRAKYNRHVEHENYLKRQNYYKEYYKKKRESSI